MYFNKLLFILKLITSQQKNEENKIIFSDHIE
jgi:hypothetical protein